MRSQTFKRLVEFILRCILAWDGLRSLLLSFAPALFRRRGDCPFACQTNTPFEVLTTAAERDSALFCYASHGPCREWSTLLVTRPMAPARSDISWNAVVTVGTLAARHHHDEALPRHFFCVVCGLSVPVREGGCCARGHYTLITTWYAYE